MFQQNRKTVLSIAVGIVIGAVGSPIVWGQGLIPTLVIDPAAIAKIVEEIGIANNILNSSLAIYRNAQASLAAFQQNVTALTNKNWFTAVRNIGANNTQNTYGETWGMQEALNSAVGVSAAWKRATMNPGSMAVFSRETPGSSQHLSNLATIEMQDSAGQTSIGVLGDYRTTDASNQASFSRLEANVADTSPAYNTEAAQLNLGNVIAIQRLKQQRAETAINAALLEQQLAANKYQRDAMASHMNLFSEVNRQQGLSDSWKVDPGMSRAASAWLVP